MAEELWPRLLAQAWASLDTDDGRLPGRLEVTGDRGRLASPLPVEDTAIACAGTALLAAAALHAQRGAGGIPTARLDRGQLAAAFWSESYLRLNGEPVAAGFAPRWPRRRRGPLRRAPVLRRPVNRRGSE